MKKKNHVNIIATINYTTEMVTMENSAQEMKRKRKKCRQETDQETNVSSFLEKYPQKRRMDKHF